MELQSQKTDPNFIWKLHLLKTESNFKEYISLKFQ